LHDRRADLGLEAGMRRVLMAEDLVKKGLERLPDIGAHRHARTQGRFERADMLPRGQHGLDRVARLVADPVGRLQTLPHPLMQLALLIL
jgi:hypothetical protein